MNVRPKFVYKISPDTAWHEARTAGTYHGSVDDRRDGFIHFSTAAQAPGTAAKFFAGQGGLVVAAIDVEAAGPALKWEPSRGGMLFPHLYGPLDMTCVVWTKPLPLGDDGTHKFPAEMI